MSEYIRKAKTRRAQQDVLTYIHSLADELEHQDRVDFGKAIICTGAAIVAQAQGPEELRAMMRAMGWTAKSAYADEEIDR